MANTTASTDDSLKRILDFVAAKLQQRKNWQDLVATTRSSTYDDIVSLSYPTNDGQSPLSRQRPELRTLVLSSSKTLLCQFLPMNTLHPLVLGYWGLIGSMFDVRCL